MKRTMRILLSATVIVLALAPLSSVNAQTSAPKPVEIAPCEGGEIGDIGASGSSDVIGTLEADYAYPDIYEGPGDGTGGVAPAVAVMRDMAPLLPRWSASLPGWGLEPYTEQHTIDTATPLYWDEDWYKLTVSPQDFADWPQLSYRIDAYTPDPDTDLVLDVYSHASLATNANILYGIDPAALVSNDDCAWNYNTAGAGRWSSVTFVPPAAGEYHIRVRPYYYGVGTGFTGEAGPYTFRIKVGQVNRLYGASRVDTAVRISQEGWATFPQESISATAVIAYSQNYPDALAAASLAGASHGPILLTPSTYLPGSVADEIKRLGVRGVYVVGGESVITQGVIDDLEAFLPANRVVRVAGSNRYTTAVEIMKTTKNLIEYNTGHSMPEVAFLVSGTNFPDALAASAMSYNQSVPILLTPPAYLHPSSASALAMYGIDDVIVAGGPAAVSDTALGQVSDLGIPSNRVLRVSGKDRYETAKEIAAWACDLKGPGTHLDGDVGTTNNPTALQWLSHAEYNAYASGATYPDALAGGALAGKIGAPILLTPPLVGTPFLFGADGEIPFGSTQWYTDLAVNGRLPIRQSYLLGGPAAVSNGVYSEIDNNTGEAP